MLVKALPHRSSNYFETVCCAGVGSDLKWRRLYPVAFRVLDDAKQFRRWDRISYRFTSPSDDQRWESQKVDPESIKVLGGIPSAERSRIARLLTRDCQKHAESFGESLTLVRPANIGFSWKRKSDAALDRERQKHGELTAQLSAFQKQVQPLDPCPYTFRFAWTDGSGTARRHTCDDWETSTAFFRRRSALSSEIEALQSLQATYEHDYASKGIRFALGTHKRRQEQWLLVGVLRVDESDQTELAL
ncbi:MAG: hypothetical protein J0M36_04940 [Caulobacterales bacterium]|nr:hypothetical protein [Caulobacterales bacterium]